MYRIANFFISKNLDKAEKMPNYRQWKVSERERAVEGPILLYIRAKGWFFDRVDQLGMRYCVLTKRGFLLIYNEPDKGFVLDMRRAFEVVTVSDSVALGKKQYRRCRIKIRYTFGTVNVVLSNAKIDLWRDRLLNAASAGTNVPRPLSLPAATSYSAVTAVAPSSPAATTALDAEISPSLVALKSFSAVSDGQAVSRRDNWARVKTPARFLSSSSMLTAADDVSLCEDDQYLAARLSDEEAPSVAETSTSGLFHYNSVRESSVSVGNLRRQLEHKIVAERLRAETAKSVPKATMMSVAAATVSPASATVSPASATVSPALSPRGPQTTISTAAKTQKHHVKYSKKHRSPVRASAKSVPSDSSSCEESRYNSFQFWRSSIFESDV
ncbi:hypothetical protein PRIPAC_85256 [Pristionchus pacificus]|uniref:DUF7778 domain-containing protein n=1 Tax=Pristionchus pacificus TaxID=54126 RepID=A0A2A6BMS7_PRIPA|nr:hypothetical protein PRIPAC_85256 [Pristionchus pacificus]|eukprot:PDM67210.1 hypothetical protein PRIPAC_48627 [Pristionchus pacificus]